MSSVPAVIENVRPPQTRALSEDAQQDIDGFRAIQYAAKLMAQSGCFADIKGVDEQTAIAKAVVKIAIGRDYGFSCAESMQYIELIQGRPSIAAHARAAKMKAAGYFWKFRRFDATICDVLVFNPKGEQLGDSVFTLEDARRMGLAEKDNWKKNPRNMLYCRAISNAQRWYAPEVLSAALASKEDVLDGSYTVMEQQPPDNDPRWLQPGSESAALVVAEEKIAAMEADAAGKKPPAPYIQDEGKPYTAETLPDACEVKVGTECLFEGDGKLRRLRATEEPGEAAHWVTVEEVGAKAQAPPAQMTPAAAVTPAAARPKPTFGRGK